MAKITAFAQKAAIAVPSSSSSSTSPTAFSSRSRRKAELARLAEFIPVKGRLCVAGRPTPTAKACSILTGDGRLQARIADPQAQARKTYWGAGRKLTRRRSTSLRAGIALSDFTARPAQVRRIDEPSRAVAARPADSLSGGNPDGVAGDPHFEGKNRQVRRMTAAIGYPTLRLDSRCGRVGDAGWSGAGYNFARSKAISRTARKIQ